MTKLRSALSVALSLGLGTIATLVACGGSSSSNLVEPAKDAGNSDALSTDAEAGDEPYTLDNICDRTGSIICEIRKPCCEASVGFDQTACLANAKASCEADVAAVRAGTMTFHGERVPGCIPKYRQVFATCLVTIELLQKHIRELAACEAFEGQIAEGGDCTQSNQCKPGATADDIAGCDGATKKCKTTKLLAENAPCSLGPTLSTLCDDGLTCDIAPSFNGTCKKKIALAAPCDKTKNPNTECGLGNYCSPSTALCTPGKSGNESCTGDLECASISCEQPDGGSEAKCRAQDTIVKPEECKAP